MKLCKAVNEGDPLFAGNFATALQSFDANEDGVITFDEFIAINRRFPTLLYPAFRLQERMQKMTLGPRKWKLIMEAYLHAKNDEAAAVAMRRTGKSPPKEKWFNREPVLSVRQKLGYSRRGLVNTTYVDAARPHVQALKAQAEKDKYINGGFNSDDESENNEDVDDETPEEDQG